MGAISFFVSLFDLNTLIIFLIIHSISHVSCTRDCFILKKFSRTLPLDLGGDNTSGVITYLVIPLVKIINKLG